MSRGWLLCIVCVMLLVIYIIFAENFVHMFRSRPASTPMHNIETGCAGNNDLYQKAANVGIVGGVLWGSASDANSSTSVP